MKANGHVTASFDITLGAPKTNKQDYMDLLSDAGFSFPTLIIQLVLVVDSKKLEDWGNTWDMFLNFVPAEWN